MEEGAEMGCRLAGLPELTTAFDAARAWSSRAAEVVELFAGADSSRKPLPQVDIVLRAASLWLPADCAVRHPPLTICTCRRCTAPLVTGTLSELDNVRHGLHCAADVLHVLSISRASSAHAKGPK